MFRRKLFEVEAVQWTGENDREVLGLTGSAGWFSGRERSLYVNAKKGGSTLVQRGSWIARENGWIHVFSDNEFREMFDGVDHDGGER